MSTKATQTRHPALLRDSLTLIVGRIAALYKSVKIDIQPGHAPLGRGKYADIAEAED